MVSTLHYRGLAVVLRRPRPKPTRKPAQPLGQSISVQSSKFKVVGFSTSAVAPWGFCRGSSAGDTPRPANTPRGAKTSAIIYSIVETAKEDGLNPSAYLLYLFERLPEIDPTDAATIDSLLPWNETVLSSLRIQKALPLNDATSA
jgi:hypothetical protein